MEQESREQFRTRVRSWCEENVPKGWRETQAGADEDAVVAFQRRWRATLQSGGFLAPHWPTSLGGSDMPLPQQAILAEEMARADAPRLTLYQIAIYNAAPAILHFGTDEQKSRFLPGIQDGEVWCQGFSEPGAGSDLASLSTRAERRGDGYVLNGQKIWTSWAMHSDWCFILVRTDRDAPKRRGISYLLMDMRSPGITVRPIEQATGAAEFCELFLNDVEVPVANRLGPENEGWQVAQTTLASERGVSILELAERLHRNGLQHLIATAAGWAMEDGSPALADPMVRERIAGFYGEVQILRAMCQHLIESMVSRGGVGTEASIIKLYYSELLQRLMDFATQVRGLPGQLQYQLLLSGGWETGNWLGDFLNSYSWTIAGGSNEIQRNIIGEQHLGLPREPRAPGDS
ncbi:acyl-CoA dehydrogenase family protein [Mycobacterium sp.]|uniref:acyl-CoA dehydrogenase family protein n=1 Tax=Mycobacterium sp. TaxID=1785 RepID=UPI0012072877|nr:acyl-CoA dehydrogenase family protein [Mycobacterium sp.]TAM64456.1 MAG: acyl-CoA dehydrogenase [Mycobacterium sp.]